MAALVPTTWTRFLTRPTIRFRIILLAGISLFFIIFIANPQKNYRYSNSAKNSDIRIRKIVSQPKKIIIWTYFWESEALWNKIFQQILDKKCSTLFNPNANNCIFTVDKSELNSSDAVLFHLIDLHPKYSFPKYRNPHQLWIAMNYEPPFVLSEAALHFYKLNGIFNLTMSYRQDADITVNHGIFTKYTSSGANRLEKQKHISMSKNGDWVSFLGNGNILSSARNYAKDKRRLVAWFVSSHCTTSQSGRENYVKELQEYVEIDIYGKCGKFRCGQKKTVRTPYKVDEDDCYYLVSVGYKFVLAFENSICEDYVTEKLYNNLKLNVVPIVFGGANYTKFAPPHSVIEARKYKPKELANYLLHLDSNDTLYNEYFNWKNDYIIEAFDGVPIPCDLCEKLHDKVLTTRTKVYKHLGSWMTEKCSPGYKNSNFSY